MKRYFTAFFLAATFFAKAQSLQKLWETDPVLAIPESVLPDTKKGILYVSLINGGAWETDGRGGVGRMKTDGSGYDSAWITGLHAPKGMGLRGKNLYVADMGEVVLIDVKRGRIKKRIPIEGAVWLNDVTISEKGVVFVSDSKTGKVWALKGDKPSLFLEGMQGVNGLKALGDDLIVASGKSFVKADRNKAVTKLADLPQGGDGVEPVGNGDFLVSAWGGYIFYVKADGTVTTLLETHAEKKNSADIGYDPVRRIVYVPTFLAKTVVAYQLK